MIPALRQQRIVQSLHAHGGQTVGELAAELQVSPSTIRRDLMHMASSGVLQRTFGGAVINSERDEPFDTVQQTNAEAKDAIAVTARHLVRDGMTVILDIGTTSLALAHALRGRQLTLVTASLPVFMLVAQDQSARTLLLGGGYRPDYECTSGHMTVAALADIHADIAFLGCSGVSPDGTIRDTTGDQVAVKRAILAAADRTVLLADASKFPGKGTYSVAPASAIDCLVTESPLGTAMAKVLRAQGTEVITP